MDQFDLKTTFSAYRDCYIAARHDPKKLNVLSVLDIDRQCVIYSVRPITCAGYHSLSNAACARSYDNPTDTSEFGVPLSISVNTATIRQRQLVVEASRSLQADDLTYELITSLQKIENNPKAIQRWKQGKNCFDDGNVQ